ncbi:MAG: hypothetical protein LBL23_04995 [Coriobacteriales bacterium]|jgi:hypothetical protein|nr:hypothetical protein [Coriobacteriales bacterium]
MDLSEIRQSYVDDGIDFENANARTAQDVMLDMISSSSMADKVTVKAGVVMQHLSHDNRRTSVDIYVVQCGYDGLYSRSAKEKNLHCIDISSGVVCDRA